MAPLAHSATIGLGPLTSICLRTMPWLWLDLCCGSPAGGGIAYVAACVFALFAVQEYKQWLLVLCLVVWSAAGDDEVRLGRDCFKVVRAFVDGSCLVVLESMRQLVRIQRSDVVDAVCHVLHAWNCCVAAVVMRVQGRRML